MKISIQGYEVNFDKPSLYWLDENLKTRFAVLADTLAENHLDTQAANHAASETIKELKNVVDLRMVLAVDRLEDLRYEIDRQKTLEIEAVADADGYLKEIIGGPYLLHLLKVKMPFLNAKGVSIKGQPAINELGLYSLQVTVEGGEVEVKLWVLPTVPPSTPRGDSNLELAS
jgi:hypothetical protein